MRASARQEEGYNFSWFQIECLRGVVLFGHVFRFSFYFLDSLSLSLFHLTRFNLHSRHPTYTRRQWRHEKMKQLFWLCFNSSRDTTNSTHCEWASQISSKERSSITTKRRKKNIEKKEGSCVLYILMLPLRIHQFSSSTSKRGETLTYSSRTKNTLYGIAMLYYLERNEENTKRASNMEWNFLKFFYHRKRQQQQ